MFRKYVLFIGFQFSWLLISEAALAELTRVEGSNHKFRYVHDGQTININLNREIGRVTHIAAVQLNRSPSFYITTANGNCYLYINSAIVLPRQFAQLPEIHMNSDSAISLSGIWGVAKASSAGAETMEASEFYKVGGVLARKQQATNWMTIEVSRSARSEDQQQMVIHINNPPSAPEPLWHLLNNTFSGKYAIIEHLSL